jgi:hypothetical protein
MALPCPFCCGQKDPIYNIIEIGTCHDPFVWLQCLGRNLGHLYL